MTTRTIAGPDRLCECCRTRPAVTRLALPEDDVRLCGTCMDDARGLGLVTARVEDIGAVLGMVGELLALEVEDNGASAVHASLTRAQTALLEASLAARCVSAVTLEKSR